MKITRIEPIPVCVPLKKGMTAKTAHGEHATSQFVIVRVHTDLDLVGLGEATISGLRSGETQAGSVAAISDYITPVRPGKDPRDITAARRAVDFIIKLNPFTKAAVEMALWDIAGKAVGLPVYRLLGGQVRDRVRIKLVVWGGHPKRPWVGRRTRRGPPSAVADGFVKSGARFPRPVTRSFRDEGREGRRKRVGRSVGIVSPNAGKSRSSITAAPAVDLNGKTLLEDKKRRQRSAPFPLTAAN